MAQDYLRHDRYYDPEQDIWIDAVKKSDKYIAVTCRNSSRGSFIPLPLHFVSVSNIAALITALTAFKWEKTT